MYRKKRVDEDTFCLMSRFSTLIISNITLLNMERFIWIVSGLSLVGLGILSLFKWGNRSPNLQLPQKPLLPPPPNESVEVISSYVEIRRKPGGSEIITESHRRHWKITQQTPPPTTEVLDKLIKEEGLETYLNGITDGTDPTE